MQRRLDEIIALKSALLALFGGLQRRSKWIGRLFHATYLGTAEIRPITKNDGKRNTPTSTNE